MDVKVVYIVETVWEFEQDGKWELTSQIEAFLDKGLAIHKADAMREKMEKDPKIRYKWSSVSKIEKLFAGGKS